MFQTLDFVMCFYLNVIYYIKFNFNCLHITAAIAQLGERQTEDLKVRGSFPGRATFLF